MEIYLVRKRIFAKADVTVNSKDLPWSVFRGDEKGRRKEGGGAN